MTHTYMTKEQRIAQEEAELAQAVADYEAQGGTTPETIQREAEAAPQAADVVTDDGTRGTPQADQQPQQSDVDWEKRYKDLQSYHDKEKAKLQAKLDEAGIQPDEEDVVAELQAQLQELQAREAERETEDVVKKAQEAVHSAHPDFLAVLGDPQFTDWIKNQPEVYQKAIYDDRPDARLAIDALSLFKLQHGTNPREQQRKHTQDQAAMSVSGGHKETPESTKAKTWTWNEINAMHPSEYAKYENEIDAAFRAGRIK